MNQCDMCNTPSIRKNPALENVCEKDSFDLSFFINEVEKPAVSKLLLVLHLDKVLKTKCDEKLTLCIETSSPTTKSGDYKVRQISIVSDKDVTTILVKSRSFTNVICDSVTCCRFKRTNTRLARQFTIHTTIKTSNIMSFDNSQLL